MGSSEIVFSVVCVFYGFGYLQGQQSGASLKKLPSQEPIYAEDIMAPHVLSTACMEVRITSFFFSRVGILEVHSWRSGSGAPHAPSRGSLVFHEDEKLTLQQNRPSKGTKVSTSLPNRYIYSQPTETLRRVNPKPTFSVGEASVVSSLYKP